MSCGEKVKEGLTKKSFRDQVFGGWRSIENNAAEVGVCEGKHGRPKEGAQSHFLEKINSLVHAKVFKHKQSAERKVHRVNRKQSKAIEEVHRYRDEHKRKKKNLVTAENNYLESEREWAEVKKKGKYYVPTLLYWGILAAIVFPELYLSTYVFKPIVGGEGWISLILFSLIIAISVPALGHFIGIKMRRDEITSKGKSVFAIISMSVILLILIASYIRGVLTDTSGFSGQNISEFALIILFLALNIAVLALAMSLSYFRHIDEIIGPHDAYAIAKKSYNRNKKEFEKIDKKYYKARENCRMYGVDLSSINEIYQTRIDEEQSRGRAAAHTYLLANDNARRDGVDAINDVIELPSYDENISELPESEVE